MSKSVKIPEVIWKTLTNMKTRDNKKTLGDVIMDLLVKAKEVENHVDTQSNSKPN